MKKIIVSAAAIVCAASLVSCDWTNVDIQTPSPTPTIDSNTVTTTPSTVPSTSEIPNVTLNPTSTPDATLTPTPSVTPTPTEPVNKFDGYTAGDFDMSVDDSDPSVTYIECSKGLVIKGNLVIVNNKYGYNSKYTSSLASIREDREGTISPSYWSLQCTPETLKAIDAMSTAYEIAFPDAKRTLIVQSAFKKSSDGGSDAYSSEYLTGLFLKLLFWDGEYTYKIDHIEMKVEKQWLQNNCGKYGFIIRYDKAKEEITGVTGNNSEFRYVGIPHSYYMSENSLCLEEYTEKIKGYTFENRLSYSDPTGDRWEMYYVPVSEGEKTRIPVDKGAEYSISGDNMSGFIVTVKKENLKSIEYSRLVDALNSLKAKNNIAYKATVSYILSDSVETDKYNVIMLEDSFKMEYLSKYTVVYKDGMLYMTDLAGNVDSTEYSFDAALRKYLPNLGYGHDITIIPTEEALEIAKIENSSNGGYIYTLYLRDRELINEQNLAYFGKNGVVSRDVLTITVKDKEVVGYSFEGRTSTGAKYLIELDFIPADGLTIDVPTVK